MSFGLMKHQLQILTPAVSTDAAGFHTADTELKAEVLASVEHRHATSSWVNRAAFTKATVLFRFRTHPDWSVDERNLIDYQNTLWAIDSVEVIGSRYIEVLAHRTDPEGETTHG